MKRRILCSLCFLLLLTLLPMQVLAEEADTTVEALDEAMLAGNVIVDGLDDSYDNPQTIFNGETLSGTVDPTSSIVSGYGLVADQNDYFRFKISTPAQVTIRVTCNKTLYSVVLWDGDGNNMTNGTTISRKLSKGTYTVSIQARPDSGTNYYSISLEYCAHPGCTSVTTPATCTGSGYARYSCSACGLDWEETIPATGHTPGQWTVTREATCIAPGTRTATCSVCGGTVTQEIPVTDHVYSDWTVTKEPTCTSGGIRTKACSGCGETVLEELPANAHSFTELELTKAPSATEAGTLSVACALCGEAESKQTLPVVTNTLTYTVPEGVTRIGSNAFSNSMFENILLPDTVTHIEYGAFYNCYNLTYITLPDSITHIEGATFDHCSNLRSITIPDSVTEIGGNMFAYCDSLTSVVIPDGVTKIWNNAFQSCTGLSSVTIPASVTQISSWAFDGCSNLKTVNITDLPAWCGIYFNGSGSNPLSYGAKLYVNGKLLTDCVIPDGVTEISGYAFYGYEYLTSLSIPASVDQIGTNAFLGCSSLSRVTISGQPYSAQFAFYGCTALKTLYFTGDAYFAGYPPYSFNGVTATAYYPAENETWTEAYRNEVEGNLNWVACPHDFPNHSCSSNGVCRNCGAVKAACHEYTEPTCTKAGACIYCNATGSEALGHTEATTTAKAPTCTETGLTEGTHCSVCGEILTAQETVPALGHDTENGKFTTCNRCGKTVEIPSVPMFRMYDPNSGEHFYSGAEAERDFLVNAGWHYEGVGFNFPEEGAPVYRLYDPEYGEHLYTMDEDEKAKLLDAGWNYEGVAFNSAPDTEVPQYRLHNPNAKRGGYHFTGSTEERDLLISFGWILQGIGWYSCLE